MRRRERLTGFFIIFILLTFSAYSNSMNVGGRIAFSATADQSKRVEQNNQLSSLKSLNNRSQTVQKNISEEDKGDQIKIEAVNREDTTAAKNKAENNEPLINTVENNIKDELIKKNNDSRNKTDKLLEPERNQQTIIVQEEVREQKEEKGEKEVEKSAFEKRHEPKLIDQVQVHKVRSGETLWDIAHKHNLNIDSLIGANNISNMNSIKPGQEFKILPVKGIIYRVSPGESVGSIAKKFELKTETIMKDNDLEDSSKLKIDQNLILRGAKPEFSYQDRLDQKFMYPINTRITSYYGPRWGRIHEGLDFAAPMGSPIRAVSSGRVVYSGWATGYGYVVIVEHQRGLRTLYAHNSKLLVRKGESVGKGEVISRSGNTGNSTGPHLHFEVQVNGRPENPLNYIHR